MRANDFRRIRASKITRHQNTNGTVDVPVGITNIAGMWDILKTKSTHHSELEWRRILDSEEVEEHLVKWCILHFAQASSTPLASERWLNLLDLHSESNSLEDILSGNFHPRNTTQEILQFLRACTRKTDDKVDTRLTFSHFKAFFRKQNEIKLSSPSGLHYGHAKTLAHDEDLLRLRFDILNLAFTHNVILCRWTKVWETLLAKESPHQFIHRFRNITIIEWDLQYLMKTIWAKRLMSQARTFLNPCQNAAAGKVPQSSVLSHKIALSTMLIKGETSFIIVNDATNCYDRILLPIAVIAILRAGLPKHAASFLLLFLQCAKHCLLI